MRRWAHPLECARARRRAALRGSTTTAHLVDRRFGEADAQDPLPLPRCRRSSRLVVGEGAGSDEGKSRRDRFAYRECRRCWSRAASVPFASRTTAPTVPVGIEPDPSFLAKVDPFLARAIGRHCFERRGLESGARAKARRRCPRRDVGPSSSTARAMSIGLRNGGSTQTAPARSDEPSMMAASELDEPLFGQASSGARVEQGVVPRTRTAACAASRAGAPEARRTDAVPAAFRHPRRDRQSFSDRPAPPWTKTTHRGPACTGVSAEPGHDPSRHDDPR